MGESEIRSLPMMAIRGTVALPGSLIPFVVARAASVRALAEAIAGDKKILLVAQRDAAVSEPRPDQLFAVGTVAHIVQSLKLSDGSIKVLVEGVERATVVSLLDEGGFCRATFRTSECRAEPNSRLNGLIRRVARAWKPEEPDWGVGIGQEDPGKLADVAGADAALAFENRQVLLETFDPMERLERVAEMLADGYPDVTISMAVLARWAESCALMNRLGALQREEIEGRNRRDRIRDLGERSRRLARHLADELAIYGAGKP